MQTADCPNNDTFEAMLLGEVDADVRSWVLQHAETCEACASTLAALFQGSGVATEPPKKPSAAAPSSKAAPSEFSPGDALTDQITIEARIGSGGMGTVYRAHHQGLGRTVAVKVLHAKLTSADAQARLLREARALAQLPTEHVVRIFDAGTLASGAAYLVMELLPGESLRDYLRRKKTLTPSEAITLAQKLCAAMAPAHERGIVHRDLKPDNIFLLPDGSLRVLDFGLSKFARETGSEGSEDTQSLTHSGAFLGTPLYVAPEQIRQAHHVDARVDVWSMGVILYEMLVGTTPFKRPSVGEVLSAVLTEKVPLITDAPPELASVVASCLAPLDERPRDASALARELKALGAAQNQSGSHRRSMYPTSISVMAALGAVALYWTQLRMDAPQRPALNPPLAETATAIAHQTASALALSIVPIDAGTLAQRALAPSNSASMASQRSAPRPTRDTLPATSPTIVKSPPF